MAQGIDVSELDKFTSTLLEIAEKKMPKELPYFMNRESLRVTKATKGEAVKAVFKINGDYHSSIKKRKLSKRKRCLLRRCSK